MKKEKIIIYLDRTIEFFLCALIFTLPFSKSMVEIFFVAALICWIAKRLIKCLYRLSAERYTLRGKISETIKVFKPVSTKLNIPIYTFAFLGFLSMLFSISLLLSLEGFFFKLFEWIMLYFVVAETISNKKKLNRVLVVMLASIVLIGIDAIFQFITGTDFIRHYASAGYRLQASFGTPNSFAGWLVIMIPLALSFAYFGTHTQFNKVIRPIMWIVTGLLVFCLALTGTRGAWIATALSLIFLSIFTIGCRKLLIFILIALLVFPFIAPRRIKERIAATFQNSEVNKIRPHLWREALNIIKDFPLLGCGLNTYAIVAPDYKITEEGGIYPHNSYLHMAAESGLLGLGTFIWITIILFKTSLANLKRMQNGFYSAVLTGLLAGLFGFLTHSFVDVNIYTLQLGNLMWFVMGLIIAVQKVSSQDLCL